MNQPTPTVEIALRVYPFPGRTPAFYPKDKLALFSLSFRSLISALGSLDARIVAILDRCPPEYRALIESEAGSVPVRFADLEDSGNHYTYQLQIETLRESTADFVYLAEDDYLYLPGALEEAVALMTSRDDVDFVTLYDHPDYYSLALHDFPARVFFQSERHWRTASTTCLTFLTRPGILNEARDVLGSFARGNHDAAAWLATTKTHVRNPLRIVRLRAVQKSFGRWPVKTWKYAWRHILFGRRMRLVCPIPALATHLESTLLAPGVDWLARAREIDERVVSVEGSRVD